MAATKRFSKQRQAIKLNLQGRCDHPSADMVYDSIRETIPSISLGTVYRNLNDLADNGEALRFTFDGKEHFDGNITAHYHFCCDSCGIIYDVFDNSVNEFKEDVINKLKCEVDDIKIVINGRCKTCLNKN